MRGTFLLLPVCWQVSGAAGGGGWKGGEWNSGAFLNPSNQPSVGLLLSSFGGSSEVCSSRRAK